MTGLASSTEVATRLPFPDLEKLSGRSQNHRHLRHYGGTSRNRNPGERPCRCWRSGPRTRNSACRTRWVSIAQLCPSCGLTCPELSILNPLIGSGCCGGPVVAGGCCPLAGGCTAPFWPGNPFGCDGVIGVAGVGVAGSWVFSAEGVAAPPIAVVEPFFTGRCYQCQHFYKTHISLVVYLWSLLLQVCLLLRISLVGLLWCRGCRIWLG